MKTLAVPIAAVGAAIAGLGTAAVLAADNINKRTTRSGLGRVRPGRIWKPQI